VRSVIVRAARCRYGDRCPGHLRRVRSRAKNLERLRPAQECGFGPRLSCSVQVWVLDRGEWTWGPGHASAWQCRARITGRWGYREVSRARGARRGWTQAWIGAYARSIAHAERCGRSRPGTVPAEAGCRHRPDERRHRSFEGNSKRSCRVESGISRHAGAHQSPRSATRPMVLGCSHAQWACSVLDGGLKARRRVGAIRDHGLERHARCGSRRQPCT